MHAINRHFRLTDQRSGNLLVWVVVRRRRPSSSSSSSSSVRICISEVLTRIVPKVGQQATWPSTPGRFFRIFDFGYFGDLAAIFWSKLVDLCCFSTSDIIFSKTVQ